MSRIVRYLAVALFVAAIFFIAPTQPQAMADRDYWNNHWNWHHNHYAPYYRNYYGGPYYGGGYYGGGYYGYPYSYGPGYYGGPYTNGYYGGTYVAPAPGVGVQVGGVGIGTWW